MKTANLIFHPLCYLCEMHPGSELLVTDYTLYRRWNNIAYSLSKKNGLKYRFKKKHLHSGGIGFIVSVRFCDAHTPATIIETGASETLSQS